MKFPTITMCSESFNSFELKEIIDSCSFDLDKDCQNKRENYFNKFYSFNSNRCCLQFNSGKNMSNHTIPILNTMVGAESNYGLEIVFRLTKASVTVYIDDPYLPPFIQGLRYKNYDFRIEPNLKHEIILSKIVESKLGLPYNPCYKDVFKEFPLNKTIINFFRSKNVSYKQKYCNQMCAELEYINTNPCNCTNTTLGNVRIDCRYKLNPRDEKLLRNCSLNYFDHFIKERTDKCPQYCPMECDSIDYIFLYRNDEISDNKTRLAIYFEEIKYINWEV
jgi:hypothetical protein